MEQTADIVMLGLGTGGEDLGLQLARSGLDVLGIEPQLVGGECAYWACIPSKMIIRAANLLQSARQIAGLAGSADVQPSWAPVARRIREQATGDWDDSIAVARFQDHGGRFVRGWGKLTGARTVAVNDQTFTARRGVVLATGSQPRIPDVPGLADSGYWVTHDVIAAETLPGSLTVLGGGAVGCELGQALSRFGVDVTIVEARDHLLPAEEPEAGTVLAEALAAEGIEVRTGERIVRVARRGSDVVATLEGGDELTSEKLLVAAGRTVDLSRLGLESAGLDASGRFLAVDEHMRAADGIWAIGDVTGKALFTHTALYQGKVAAADILGEPGPPASYDAVPRACFTDPQVGAVGLTEARAREAGVNVVTVVKRLPVTFRGWVHGPHAHGVYKLVIDRDAGLLIGGTAVGPHGAEILGMLSTMVHGRVPVDTWRHMIWAYPTFFGGIGEALGGYARGITKVMDPESEPLLVP